MQFSLTTDVTTLDTLLSRHNLQSLETLINHLIVTLADTLTNFTQFVDTNVKEA